jgi:hypothetical protein
MSEFIMLPVDGSRVAPLSPLKAYSFASGEINIL